MLSSIRPWECPWPERSRCRTKSVFVAQSPATSRRRKELGKYRFRIADLAGRRVLARQVGRVAVFGEVPFTTLFNVPHPEGRQVGDRRRLLAAIRRRPDDDDNLLSRAADVDELADALAGERLAHHRQGLLAVMAGRGVGGIAAVPLDVGIEELADGVEVPAQGGFIAASGQLHIGHWVIVAARRPTIWLAAAGPPIFDLPHEPTQVRRHGDKRRGTVPRHAGTRCPPFSSETGTDERRAGRLLSRGRSNAGIAPLRCSLASGCRRESAPRFPRRIQGPSSDATLERQVASAPLALLQLLLQLLLQVILQVPLGGLGEGVVSLLLLEPLGVTLPEPLGVTHLALL